MRGYRKLIVVVLTLTFAFALGLLEKLTGDFALIASVCVGAYAAGNAAVHFANKKEPEETEA